MFWARFGGGFAADLIALLGGDTALVAGGMEDALEPEFEVTSTVSERGSGDLENPLRRGMLIVSAGG
jgi:hypothetical protein